MGFLYHIAFLDPGFLGVAGTWVEAIGTWAAAIVLWKQLRCTTGEVQLVRQELARSSEVSTAAAGELARNILDLGEKHNNSSVATMDLLTAWGPAISRDLTSLDERICRLEKLHPVD